MESIRNAQGGPEFHYTSIECRSSSHTKKNGNQGDQQNHSWNSEGGSEEIKAGEVRQGGVFPRVVI